MVAYIVFWKILNTELIFDEYELLSYITSINEKSYHYFPCFWILNTPPIFLFTSCTFRSLEEYMQLFSQTQL